MREPLFDAFIKDKGIVILDGALATELETRGADLNHALWSAKLLTENPDMIRQVHLDYLLAGADVITSASYQASFTGFAKYGYTRQEAAALMQLSVSLALEARAEMLLQQQTENRPLSLVAASVGPYGASLADGSEYRGDYGLSIQALIDFHLPRMAVLTQSGADLLACETIPCPEEAIALMEALKAFPTAKAWISFSCKNGEQVCSGAPVAECIALMNQCGQVIATGVNCTSPEYVESLLRIAGTVTSKPILAYPNKGGKWDAEHKCWMPGKTHADFHTEAKRWFNAGATLIGGCCRTSPADIRELRDIDFANMSKNGW